MKRKKILVKSVKRLANKTNEATKTEYARFSLYESREHFCIIPAEIVLDANNADVTECPIAVGTTVIAIQQEITNQESGQTAIMWAFLTDEDAKEFAKREADRDIDNNVDNLKVVARAKALQSLNGNLRAARVDNLLEESNG